MKKKKLCIYVNRIQKGTSWKCGKIAEGGLEKGGLEERGLENGGGLVEKGGILGEGRVMEGRGHGDGKKEEKKIFKPSNQKQETQHQKPFNRCHIPFKKIWFKTTPTPSPSPSLHNPSPLQKKTYIKDRIPKKMTCQRASKQAS